MAQVWLSTAEAVKCSLRPMSWRLPCQFRISSIAESCSGFTDRNPTNRVGYWATCAAVNSFSRRVSSAISRDFK